MTIKPSVDRPAGLEWFKSSYSTNEGPDCVEVAHGPGSVHVRDSKDKEGPRFRFSQSEWSAFVGFAAELG
ncbi:DUF397 domain-containing protein [Streptomyces sp. CBMA156]|uniref:DUF397 domain-containing protein n=1 Tax=Streptomyces sp. CBMA156 TaxID=1930280 RepID=UPI001661E629|nr:DUF397 domain-containing protein [Streptomyces sp. CBMA156]MBD0670724.1 DUF397 domain-containing protein [Streptomyces sp. CBMA156]